MSSDERLVKRAAEGDSHALEAIYRRYQRDLYRFCLAMVGNTQDAQDALQNTMVKVLRALPGEEREIKLKPWLYRIARNESVETLRKRRDNAELEAHQAVAVGVTETAETRERLRTLLADLEQLPERQRAALVMRELSGLDFDQIGAAFDSSPAVARQTLYEARLSLRQLEVGREMRCDEVMRELSDADGRVTRRREIRAHLRSCPDCQAFRDEIAKRHEDLAALAPLPLAASAGLLHGILGKAAADGGAALGGASGAGGLAGSVGAGAGQAVATSAIVKSAATIAVVAVVGVSAADRGGLIDLPLPDGGGSKAALDGLAPRRAAAPAEPASAVPSGTGAAEATSQADNGQKKSDGSSPKEEDGPTLGAQGDLDAAPGTGSSNSQSGLNPPGGGYGRSASEGRGRPDQLPQAASHGQQTAAAKKPAQAAPPRGESASTKGRENRPEPPGGKPASPKAKAPDATPAPQHPAASPGHADASPPQHSGGTPPGLQR